MERDKMDYSQKKFEFLKTIKAPNLKDLLTLAVETKAEDEVCTYVMLTAKNAHRTGQVPFEDVENLCELLYVTWYQNTLSAPQSQLSREVLAFVEKLKNSPHLHPDAVRKQGFYNFIESGKLREEFGNTNRMRFAHNQYHEGFISRDITRESLPTDFLYITPRVLFGRKQGSETTRVDCRFYLNLKAQNICKVAREIVLQSKAKKLSIEFKIAGNDNRNDTLVIYTNYLAAPKIVSALNEIKVSRPELFDGCEKMGPALGKIDGFIGFGEESTFPKTSFNLQRAHAIDRMMGQITNQTVRSIIIDDRASIVTTDGERLSRLDYLKYLIKNRIKSQADFEIDFSDPQYTEQIDLLAAGLQARLIQCGNDTSPIGSFGWSERGNYVNQSKLNIRYEDKLASVFGIEEKDIDKRNFLICEKFYSSSNLGDNVVSDGKSQNIDDYLFDLFQSVICKELSNSIISLQESSNPQILLSRQAALKEVKNGTLEGEKIIKDSIFNYKMRRMHRMNTLASVIYPLKFSQSQSQQEQPQKAIKMKKCLNFDFDAAVLNACPDKFQEMQQRKIDESQAEIFFKEYDVSHENFALNHSTQQAFEQFKYDEFMDKISRTPSFF